MIDHLVGRPNPSWKRTQVYLVILFWLWRIVRGSSGPPRLLFLPRINRALQRFTPWQIILSTLTTVYAMRHMDKILGLNAPEPLARLYSPSYYRVTWIVTGLDAGFATAMAIRPKWLRDIASLVFSVYYMIYAQEADEKLRRFRAVPTIEMLRVTWEKTSNPYLKLITHLRSPRVCIRRKIHLPRPKSSSYDRPITAWLYFAPPEDQLINQTELVLDFPGGGFIAMSPEDHEERLRVWAKSCGRPILALDYGKAPEYPYPFAIDEAFDTYRVLVESNGTLIGLGGKQLSIIMSGDSAGGCLAVNVVFKILESKTGPRPINLPLPTALVLSYAALDFNFTSWMTTENLQTLRAEQSSGNVPGIKELAAQKDHLKHVSPLSMVSDSRPFSQRKQLKRRSSWKDTLKEWTNGAEGQSENTRTRSASLKWKMPPSRSTGDEGSLADGESSEDNEDYNQYPEEDRPIQARVRYEYPNGGNGDGGLPRSKSALERQQRELSMAVEEANTKATLGMAKDGSVKLREPIGTRLTMTSRTGYFQDRIVAPSMMRAMAILYIGPHRNPDFYSDYRISPILAPPHLLAQFPPLLMQCGEKDPFVDDTVIFAGRVREAKRARKVELDLLLSGKSARFGETLRMTTAEPNIEGKSNGELRRERDKLAAESELDWVQMVLFSDWSHGYLQMPALLSEASAVIEDLAEWINEAFVRYRPSTASGDRRDKPTAANGVKNDTLKIRVSSPKESQSKPNPSPLTSASETETDSGITIVPKKYQDQSRKGSMEPSARIPQHVRASPHIRSDSSETVVSSSSPPSTSDLGHGGSGTPGGTHTPRLVGQTITESELMRRRRLLDSYILD
ncbi:Alpha/Beta hydrolase protein [Ephemerocybe angulata]|uniref:Alpha/Beta hydrolase protein n=1 Tax=Ephemerocybe angulata TaxID=980116 RepID=A0A8H6IBQ3_9AGAR|nr:Alpha/Beta hydrolase protein [Tulosesus angulatus]